MELNLSTEYDHKALKKYLIIAAVMIAAFKFTGGFAAALIPFLVVGSLSKRKPIESLFWVLFMTMTSIGNRAIFANGAVSVLIVRATLLLLTFILGWKVFSSRASKAAMIFFGILPYIFWEAVVSIQGWEPIVSYLKITLFLCIFLALFGVANEVNASTRVNAKVLRSVILTVVVIMILGSIVIIPFPALSMMAINEETAIKMANGEITSLFCGMCAHSQAMGPLSGVLGTLVFADMIFSIKKWDKLYLAILLGAAVCCYKTSSRTGMGTLIAGLGFTAFMFMQSRGLGVRWKGKVVSALTLLAVLGGVGIIAIPQMREKIAGFALKWGGEKRGEDVTVENMFATRMGKIDGALAHFKDKPITGNGFQVSEEMSHQHREGLLAYLAAPVEKGVWLFAILEEGGAVGLILFAGWLLILFPALIKRHAYIMAATYFAFIMSNTGEFSMFAMTYVGGFYWTLTFAAGCLDVQRMKGQGIQVFEVPIEQVIAEVTAREGMDAWTRRLG